jgi:preprotein translocase subunit SecG
MLFGTLVVLHVLICLVLVAAVLLQSGRGGGLVSAFGTSGGSAIFGGRGAGTFLTKATTILGAAFMLTSLVLALLSGAATGGRPKSALEREAERAASEVPSSLPPAGESPFPSMETAPAGGTTEGGAGTPGTPAPQGAPAPQGSPAPNQPPQAAPAPGTPTPAPPTPPQGNPGSGG